MPEPKLGQISNHGALQQCMGLPLPTAEPQSSVATLAGSNLVNLPQAICRGGFNGGVPVKPGEEVSTPQLSGFVPVTLLATFIVLMQLFRLPAETGRQSTQG